MSKRYIVDDETQARRFFYSLVVLDFACPKCGELSGFYCLSPSGNKHWPPHKERTNVAFDANKRPLEIMAR